MENKKITLATLKKFIKDNEGNLYIKIESTFNMLTDSIEFVQTKFKKTEFNKEKSKKIDRDLGYKGLWIVGNGDDNFINYEDENFIGIKIINCCGVSIIAIKKENNEVSPKIKEKIDFKPLIKICEEYIKCLKEGEYFKDADHYIFETALECIFGENIWKWINNR
mgnify:CR=1 FL=1